MAAPASRLRSLLRVLGWALLGLAALVGILAATLFLVGRSDWGRRQILNAVLPALRPVLTGELRVGALEGDLTHMLVLRDVELTDAEGQVAVRMSRLGLRYNLLALLGRTLHVTAADGAGEVHLRHLRDGELNLARLVRPSEPTGPLPLRIRLGGIKLDLVARYDAPPTQPPQLQHAQAQLSLRASLSLAPDRKLELDIAGLDGLVSAPAQAQLHLSGGLTTGPGTAGGLGLRGIKASVKTSGEQLDQLVSALELRGNLAMSAELDGSLANLGAKLELDLPTGKVTAQGKIRPLAMEQPWELWIRADDVDPSVRVGLPPGRIALDVSMRGFGASGRIALRRFQINALGTDLQASGWLEAPAGRILARDWRGLSGEAQLSLNASALAQLAQLPMLGLPPLAGAVKGTAQAKLHDRSLELATALEGSGLRGFGAALDQISLAVDAAERAGQPSFKVKLGARGLGFKGQRFAQLSLDASGSHDTVQLTAAGQGPQQVSFRLAVSGRPAFAQPAGVTSAELRSLDAEVKELRLSQAERTLSLEQPARVLINLHSAPIIDLEHLALALGEQRLSLDAHYETAGQKLTARAAAHGLDVKQLLAVAGLEVPVPSTQLELGAQVSGTLHAPVGQLTLSGEVGPPPQLPLPKTAVKLTADFNGVQVKGQLAIKTLGEAAASDAFALSTRFALPLSDREKLSLDATLETALPALHPLLPASLHSLTGALTLHATAAGTLQRPELALRLQLPSWRSDWGGGKETLLVADCRQSRLAVLLDSQLTNPGGLPLGKVKLSAQAPLLLGLQLSAQALVQQLTGPSLNADLALSALDLPQLWKMVRNDEAPIKSGLVELSAQLHGPLLDSTFSPTLKLKLVAHDLMHPGRSGLPNVKTSGELRLLYQSHQLGVEFDGDVEGQRLIQGHAATTLRLPELLRGGAAAAKQLPISGVVDVLPTEIPAALPVRGQFRMHGEVAGTVNQPKLFADLSLARLMVQDWLVGDVTVHATADSTSLLNVTATVQQQSGKEAPGAIKVTAAVPLPPSLQSDALRVGVQIHGYRLNYELPKTASESYGGLLLLRGLLDAELDLDGGEPQPRTSGFLRFSQGELAASALPELFRDISVDLKLDPSGLITLRKVTASAESGRATVDGTVQLDGLLVRKLGLKVTATAFPLAAGPIGLWVDSKVSIQGETSDDTLRTKVVVTSGTVRLPKLASSQSTQPLGPLEDIRFVDAVARRAAAEAERRAAEAARDRTSGKKRVLGLPHRTLIAVELPPPFYVVGPEVKTELEGHLDIELVAPTFAPIVSGAIHTNGGWVEILDGRYQLERAQVSMAGESPPTPLIDVLISRKLDDVTLYVRVSGSARRPKLSFSSDPATYDESQVLMMVISGGKQRTGTLQQQAIGTLSSLMVGQLKKQLGPLLPVDELRLNAGGSDPMGMNQSSLEVGKYIRDDLFLLYTHRFGNWANSLRRFNNDEVSLEWRFLTNYQINLMAGDQGVGALNLYWTKRF